MEKDNKSVPMRVFSNTMSSFPIDTKSGATTTTSIMQPSAQQATHRHAIHSRLTDIQMCANDIIDLTSASQVASIGANMNAPARNYELTKINTNMMSIYDSSNIGNYAENSNIVNNLDILKGISKGKKKI